MSSDAEKLAIKRAIHNRVYELRERGAKTGRGEPMSLAAIGRTLDPPVRRQSVSLVAAGKSESERIKRAIERELGQPYWMRRKCA